MDDARPIRRPNGLLQDCLAARVLDFMENNQLGLAALAAAAEVVAADCRFNIWVSEEVKSDPSLTIDWWEDFLRECAEIDERCSAAMTALVTGGYLQKAAAANLQIDWRPENAWLQCGSGQFEPATSYLSGALKLKPKDISTWGRLRTCLKFARRWPDMRALVDDASSRPASIAAEAVARDDVYLTAEETGKPADVAKAQNLAIAAPSGSSSEISNAIEALSTLGLVDDGSPWRTDTRPAR